MVFRKSIIVYGTFAVSCMRGIQHCLLEAQAHPQFYFTVTQNNNDNYLHENALSASDLNTKLTKWASKSRFTHNLSFPCRAHAIPLPCRATKSLECVFPIWFTQCGRVWFTLSMPCPCHAPTMLFFSRPQHSTTQHGHLSTAVLCCCLEKNGMVGAWHGHVMASVNQTRPHCVNQMGKTHSKPLAARHDRGKTWTLHGNGMLCVNRP